MGREIRWVPAGWEHPCNSRGDYIPLYNQDYDTAATKWIADLLAWEDGTHPERAEATVRYFWEWEAPPPEDRKHYRPKWTDEERTHVQLYETVSEGTPVSPVFPDKAALLTHLVEHGDDWGGPWNRRAAEQFIEDESAPTMIVRAGPAGLTFQAPGEEPS